VRTRVYEAPQSCTLWGVTEPAQEARRTLRVAAVSYRVNEVSGFEEFSQKVEYFVRAAATSRADFVVFPEFVSLELLSQPGLRDRPSLDSMHELSKLEPELSALGSELAKKYGLHVILGTHPSEHEGHRYNVCPVFTPAGARFVQPKLHITPAERRDYALQGGDSLSVIATPKAKIGVLVCYDSEFPEAARHLADQGADIVFVPFCTDDRQGYMRVRACCHARAIENQVYVVTAGIVGNLHGVVGMDIHYGGAAVFAPSDFGFSRDGIQAESDPNVETLLVTELDLGLLARARAAGSVTPRLDRRSDLFESRFRGPA
jgi:predicted amidohydrolase